MSAGSTFTAAMVQMRTGLLPEPSLAQGTELIREAAAQGADYVLTPEVSNMMQLNRKALFEHLAPEEDDRSLKAYRALAAELKIHLHIGSLALRYSPERAVNRSFLIGPEGNLLASYDKIHMFDIDLPGGESYRESANYQPGETAVISDLPWGRRSVTTCASPRSIGRWPKPARRSSRCRRLSRKRPARRIGTPCCAPARSRTAVSCSPPRRPACMRTSARPTAIR
jgi:predicted amidohydrolase